MATRQDVEVTALTSLTRRMKDRAEYIVDEMVSTYREEIDGYRDLDDDTIYGDVATVALDNLHTVLVSTERGATLDPAALERFRISAARRVHQGVSLDALLHAYVMGCRVMWDSCQRIAPRHSGATTVVADALFRHLNAASRIVANGYIREASTAANGSIPRRDLLDALLSGDTAALALDASSRAAQGDLAASYAVIVARATSPLDAGPPQSERTRRLRAITHAQRDLRPRRGGLLAGLRDGDLIALVPLADRDELAMAAERADKFAAALAGEGFVVGISGWHPGHAGVPAALRDAQSAVDVASALGTRGRCVRFDDIVVEHIMRTSPHAGALLEDVVGRLRAYDVERNTDLLPTLRAYIAANLNVSRTAAMLHVHANTVAYRLRRVAELVQRDPLKADDLVVLMIALKADELEAGTLRS